MSATLVVSAIRPPQSASSLPVLLRVRPARGRTLERPLAPDAPQVIPVSAGEVAVDAIFPSGRVDSRTYSLSEGQELRIDVAVPTSRRAPRRGRGEVLESLQACRDTEPRVDPLPSARSATAGPLSEEAHFDDLEALTPTTPPPGGQVEAAAAVAIIARGGPAQTAISGDQLFPEGRVVHVVDPRPVHVFRGGGGSELSLLRITHPAAPGKVRLCALPGPLGPDRPPEAREEVVVLRTREGDPLPEVHVMPSDPDVASIVGFLGRGDQRSLDVLRDDVVGWAIRAMEEKGRDPIVAAIGLAVLLRVGDEKAVHGWSANLWQLFPSLPDGAALHAAVILQQSASDFESWGRELRRAVLDAARAGLPLLSDSLRHLRCALTELCGEPGGDAELDRAAAWCNRLVRAMDPGAVITTVTLDETNEKLVWGFET